MSGARDLWVTVRCGCALGTRERVAHMSHGRQVECSVGTLRSLRCA